MDARLETNVPKTTLSYGSSAEELVSGAVSHLPMEIDPHEPRQDAKPRKMKEMDPEKILKYNDDAVYNEHLKLFLDQTEPELEHAVHETNNQSEHKKKDLDCPICSKKFKLKNRLDLHIRKFHITSSYACNNCEFKSECKKEAKNHVLEKHSVSNATGFKEARTCNQCNKESKSYKTLVKHVSVHRAKNEKPFVCVDCGFKAGTKKELRTHNAEAHEKTLEKEEKRSCSQCDYQTEWGKSHLDRHIRAIHDRIKDFQCPFCEISCSQKGNLRLHIDQVHKNIRKFSCEQCDYKSNFKYDIAKHKKSVHEKTQDIRCPYCSFKRYTNVCTIVVQNR